MQVASLDAGLVTTSRLLALFKSISPVFAD